MESDCIPMVWAEQPRLFSAALSCYALSDKMADCYIATSACALVPAHKIVLASLSTYFRHMFETIKGNRLDMVIITEASEDILRKMLKYMYTGYVQLFKTEINEFLKLGKQFGIQSLSQNSFLDESKDEDVELMIDDDGVQSKELDLSRNCSSGNRPSSPSPTSLPRTPGLLPKSRHPIPGQLQISRHLLEDPRQSLLDKALAMRSSSIFNSSINSPQQAGLPGHQLSRSSPLKCSPPAMPNMTCDMISATTSRHSNSPEGSTYSNNSLDLTAPSAPTNPPIMSTVPSDISALASHIQQNYNKIVQMNKSESYMSNLHNLSSIQRESNAKLEDEKEENRSRHSGGHSSSPYSGKQITSSNGSPDENSDDESIAENDYNSEIRPQFPGHNSLTPTELAGGLLAAKNSYEWFQKSTMAERINDAHHGPAPVGFWKNNFSSSILGPYLGTTLTPISPGGYKASLSSTFPSLYPPSSISNLTSSTANSPPSLTSFLRINECARCGRLYKTRKGLKHHIKNECGVEPRFQCLKCDWKFKQKAHLLRHMARKHASTPPCPSNQDFFKREAKIEILS